MLAELPRCDELSSWRSIPIYSILQYIVLHFMGLGCLAVGPGRVWESGRKSGWKLQGVVVDYHP